VFLISMSGVGTQGDLCFLRTLHKSEQFLTCFYLNGKAGEFNIIQDMNKTIFWYSMHK
jgi:hypothetical protein